MKVWLDRLRPSMIGCVCGSVHVEQWSSQEVR